MDPIDLAIGSWHSQLHSQLLLPEDERTSMHEIARHFGILQSILSRCISGQTFPQSQAHIPQHALTNNEEETLIEYICCMLLSRYPPLPYTVTAIALEFFRDLISIIPLPNQPILPRLGHDWVSCIRKRHPKVASVCSRNLYASGLHT